MELPELIEALSTPAAYLHPVEQVEVRQTHISLVFLAGPIVYKLKKPVNLGFLDFTTREKRRHFCEEEVRLNRRLAARVYLGVVPVTRSEGGLKFEGDGEVIEWAVKMARLPEEATLEQRVLRGDVDASTMQSLARVIAGFHANAQTSPHIASFGRFNVVATNARENFDQAQPEIGKTVSPTVFERCREATERWLGDLHDLIEDRAQRGVPRDTHGDLHLDHVYLFPEHQPPDDLAIIDCIEFNERFRYADPIADMAFLVMDLKFHGRGDLAAVFADAYFQASGDAEGRRLLPFYTAYRSIVRAKVKGIKLREIEVPESEKAGDMARARAHWLLGLSELEPPSRRPALMLVGGLPGTGKSALARELAAAAGFTVIRSDVIRKELAGVPLDARPGDGLDTGIYAPEWTDRTYAECLRRAEQALFEGGRVIVDATFREDARRDVFLTAARNWSIPALWLECRTQPEIARARLEARRGDASDANWNVHQHAAARWEPPGPRTTPALRVIDTTGPLDQTVAAVLEVLKQAEWW